jgi:hypothetical protein
VRDAASGGGPAVALSAAAALLEAGLGPSRARTVARLLRYALEAALDEYWDLVRAGEVPKTVPRARRLRLLAATCGRKFAHDTYTTWCRLSDASRPAPYEPPPSTAELRELQRRTEDAVAGLIARASTSAPATGS